MSHLLGVSLDHMRDHLAWPAYGLDPCRLAAQAQVIRVIATVATKVDVEAARGRERALAAMDIRQLNA